MSHTLATRGFWKAVNPLVRPFAGIAPWWVVLETTGCRTGRVRHTPLAAAPFDGGSMSVVAVYGLDAAFVRNVCADPAVRVKRRGRWFSGTAEVVDPTATAIASLGRYARAVVLRMGSDPKVIKITVP